MILGTVELGLNYGINNKIGKPSIKEANRILDSAWTGGVRELDTAYAYGDSEKIIGVYQQQTGRRFRIDTKLPPDSSSVCESFERSRGNLMVSQVNVLYVHAFEMCKDRQTMNLLSELKQDAKIAQIGISVYEPEELRYITENVPQADVVQLPINLFNSRYWRKDDTLKKAKQRGIRLLARSIYLQGLVFKPSEDAFVKHIGAEKYLAYIWALCVSSGISPAELSYGFVCAISEIDDILMGCETAAQLTDNLKIVRGAKMLSAQQILEIEEKMSDIPSVVIDPRKWSK